jgi:hypothetical protein
VSTAATSAGSADTHCRRRINSMMRCWVSKTVRRRVSVGCAVITGATSAPESAWAADVGSTSAASSFAYVAARLLSCGGSPARTWIARRRSRWMSSATFASSAK